MIALDLIESIFSRPQHGPPGVRRITPEQLGYLHDLILKDAQRDKARSGMGRSLVWSPAGAHKYILTEDLVGRKHTLTRLSRIDASEMGSLF